MKYQELYPLIALKLDTYFDNRTVFESVCDELFNLNVDTKRRLKARNPNGKIFDPLSLLCIINGYGCKNRIQWLNELCRLLNMDERIDREESFRGVSILDHSHRVLPGGALQQYNQCVDLCWEILHYGVFLFNNHNDKNATTYLATTIDTLSSIEKRTWDRVSHALSYCFPNFYLALSSPNRAILSKTDYLDKKTHNIISQLKLYQFKGDDYVELCNALSKNKKGITVSELSALGYELKSILSKEHTWDYKKKSDGNDSNVVDILESPRKQHNYSIKEIIKQNSFPRDEREKAVALAKANYTCQCCGTSETFMKNGSDVQYMEGHHLIPIKFMFRPEFDGIVDIDDRDNIVCLCPKCHRAIHHGTKSVVNETIDLIYEHFDNDAFERHYPMVTKKKLKTYYSKKDVFNDK